MIDKIKNHIEEVKAFHADNKEKVEEFRIKYLEMIASYSCVLKFILVS